MPGTVTIEYSEKIDNENRCCAQTNLFSFLGFGCQLQTSDVFLRDLVGFRQQLSDEQNLVALNENLGHGQSTWIGKKKSKQF